MKPLVGAEIQHHKINIGMGWDRIGVLVMLETYLIDLHLGTSYHMILPVAVPSKKPK
jgi:hypothetical protein